MNKYCSESKLKVLNEKEKELKDKIMSLIIDCKATNKECVRVFAFLLNAFKNVKYRKG